jgi:hypothetical protein
VFCGFRVGVLVRFEVLLGSYCLYCMCTSCAYYMFQIGVPYVSFIKFSLLIYVYTACALPVHTTCFRLVRLTLFL